MSGAVAIDLGSTSFKAARVDANGRLQGLRFVKAPALRGTGGIREVDGTAYTEAARELLRVMAAEVPRGTRLGLSCQRSTFVLWDARTSVPLLPMVSWQDSRAASWCAEHPGLVADVFDGTGLHMSAHYVGPKLAAMQRGAPEVAELLAAESTRFGTLDTYLLWLETEGAEHVTDVTMAARTALFDLEHGDWSEPLTDSFGVPRRCLPRVLPTDGYDAQLASGLRLTAAVSDQGAAALALLGEDEDQVLVNLGTGTFVLRPGASATERVPGYLTAPVFAPRGSSSRYVLEGAISGSGPAVDRFGAGPTALPVDDPSPEAFCLPDSAGLGAPHWRPDLRLVFSAAAERLDRDGKRRTVLEGLLFRIRSVIDDLCPTLPARILIAGGLARDPFVADGLPTLLGRTVEVLEVFEAGLIGAGRLAAGARLRDDTRTRLLVPRSRGAYLPRKYEHWRTWLRSVLD